MDALVTSLQPIFAEVVMALALALAGLLLAVIRKYTAKAEEQLGVKMDADRILVFENALKNAVVQQATVLGQTTPAQILAYLRQMNPDTLDAIGLGRGADPLKVATRLDAAIARYTPPSVEVGPTDGTTARAPVSVVRSPGTP